MHILTQQYRIEMPNGDTWYVPINIIAVNRAHYYAEIDKIPFSEALTNTVQEFHDDPTLIHDWASGSMDWNDVKDKAMKTAVLPTPEDFQEGWINGNYAIVGDAGD